VLLRGHRPRQKRAKEQAAHANCGHHRHSGSSFGGTHLRKNDMNQATDPAALRLAV
jgi:hypothetical protein